MKEEVLTFDLNEFLKKDKTIYQLSQAEEVGFYSINNKRELKFDKSELKEFVEPPLPIDLNPVKEEKIVESHIDNKFLVETIEKTLKDVESKVEFISYRNNLNKLMNSFYNKNDYKIILDPKDLGDNKKVIYFEIFEEEDQEKNFSNNDWRNINYGFKFEDLCTKDNAKEEKTEEGNDKNRASFMSIVKRSIFGFGGEKKLLIAAEMDAITENKSKKNDNKRRNIENKKIYVELKTCKIGNNYSFNRFKLLSSWIQTFIVGVPLIIFGMRDDEGKINSFKRYPTNNIPSVANKHKQLWNPQICISILYSVLDWISNQNLTTKCKYFLSYDSQKSIFTISPISNN